MARKKKPEPQAPPSAKTPAPDLPPGVTLRHTLRGHTDYVGRIAWSPDGRVIASPSEDKTIRLWDAETGALVRTLQGHSNAVVCVAWSPDGRSLASGGGPDVGPGDTEIRLWEAPSGRLIRTLEWPTGLVLGLAWSPDGEVLASASWDNTIRLWDVQSGRFIRDLSGHSAPVHSLAWSRDGKSLASGSHDGMLRVWEVADWRQVHTFEAHRGDFGVVCVAWSPNHERQVVASAGYDTTIRIWDCAAGRQVSALEGHTDFVKSVAFSRDAQLLASKGADNDSTIRIWRCDTWEPVAVIAEPAGAAWPPGVAFHPGLPRLATVGSVAGAEYGKRDTLIHVWDLDLDLLLRKPAERARHHTTAKIVLVGDSGVGKTGLGWRLAHGEFKEHASTHGQQFWVLSQLGTRRADGTDCEAILWDLAGQPDYRLIHALFLDDADLALVLFDPTDSQDPLRGVEFWLKQLQVARSLPHREAGSRGEPATILVGARVDRGAATLTAEDLEAFCQRRGISGRYVATSALSGEGLEELLHRMKDQVPWDLKTTTVTTATFKRIKDYVLGLKANLAGQTVIVPPEELRARLEKTDATWQFTDAEMMTAVGHLANYGYVRVLRTSAGEDRVLLAPELLNNLAASFVLEARRNPKGLGSLEERRLVAGEYPFRELEKLSAGERDVLVDSAAAQFLEHHVAFRETDPLGGQSYLVFPELINLKKPVLEDEKPTEDGVSYTVTGAVENVYASLVVLLGYTHTFTRTDQWHNQARYEVGDGLVCGFRQAAEREGELDLVLYFSTDVGRPVRTLLQGLFESFLARRSLTVVRYEPVPCPKCGRGLERSVIRERLREKKDFAFCNECGQRLALPKADEPIQLSVQEARQVEAQGRIARERTRFEQAVLWVQAYVTDTKRPRPECFISYAWGVREHERWVERRLATDLQKAGIRVVLDRWHNPIGSSIPRFVDRIEKCDRIIVVGTPLYRQKYENKLSTTGSVVAAEVDRIDLRMLGTEEQKRTVLPLLLDGDAAVSFPPSMRGRVFADFRDEPAYFRTAFDLILGLYGIPPDDRAVADLRESLCGMDRF